MNPPSALAAPVSARPRRHFVVDVVVYAAQVRQFGSMDWIRYVAWVGLMLGLLFAVTGFVVAGQRAGVSFPAYVWNLPIGTAIFVAAISFDTIGHLTTYKTELERGERLVHHITIFAGVTSCVLLSLAFTYPVFLRIPALAFVALSIFYSAIDEAMHWFRYFAGKSDRVEMWSHFFIFVGHTIFVLTWWHWYDQGYPGVAETLLRYSS